MSGPETFHFFDNSRIRILMLGTMVLGMFGALIAKLYFEQLHRGEVHRENISRQSIRRIRVPAPRGRIMTSDLLVLADNTPAYDVCFYLEEMRRPGRSPISYIQAAAQALFQSLGRENTLTEQQIRRHISTRPGLPLTVAQALTAQEMAKVYDYLSEWRGIAIVPRTQRHYPQGALAASLVGYARLEEPRRAPDFKEFNYYLPDLSGRSGLEKVFEHFPENLAGKDEALYGLRGDAGYMLVRVDNLGYIHDVLDTESAPRAGNNLILTIDSNYQLAAERLLRGVRGALVLLDSDNGDVLAMASSPGYDLRDFSPRLSPEYYQSLLKDPARPLDVRPLERSYAPGSILKPLVALAVLENNISPARTVVCDGGSRIGNARIRCTAWRRGGHGPVNVRTALRYSCNDYFVEMGVETGLDAIARVLDAAGIGQPCGLELPERKGAFPSRELKESVYKMKWNAYDTGLLSMGQGLIELTPLQAAVYTAALQNGGKVLKPHLVKNLVDPSGNYLYTRNAPEVRKTLPAAPEYLEQVQRGMWEVVNASDGTGKAARSQKIELSGKTGTAQYGPRGNLKENSWFIGFGSAGGRNFAIAVLVEDWQTVNRRAAAVAGEFFDAALPDVETL